MRRAEALAMAAVLAAAATPALAADITCTASTATRLNVNVTGVRSAAGQVAVTLYANDPKRFLKSRGSLGVARTPATAGTTRVCVAAPEPGQYALAVYHDQDGDGKIDRTVIGLPAEPFALSNNPPPKMAWPKIGPSLISVGAGETTVTVRLEKGRHEKEAPAAG